MTCHNRRLKRVELMLQSFIPVLRVCLSVGLCADVCSSARLCTYLPHSLTNRRIISCFDYLSVELTADSAELFCVPSRPLACLSACFIVVACMSACLF